MLYMEIDQGTCFGRITERFEVAEAEETSKCSPCWRSISKRLNDARLNFGIVRKMPRMHRELSEKFVIKCFAGQRLSSRLRRERMTEICSDKHFKWNTKTIEHDCSQFYLSRSFLAAGCVALCVLHWSICLHVYLLIDLMQIWRLLISINWISSTKEMNPITRKSTSKLVMQPSFRAVGQTHAECMGDIWKTRK